MCPSPGDIVDDIVDFGKDIIDFTVELVESAIDLVMTAVELVMSPFGMAFDQPSMNDQLQQQIQGVLVNKDSAVERVPIVYGTRKVGGIRVFVSTNGTDNKYLFVALVMSEGQVNGFTKLFIDENEVPLSSYAHGVQSTPTTGKYANKLICQFFDGRDDQTASSLLQNGTPNWTSDHRLQGLAYVALRFEWTGFNTSDNPDNNPYGGIPKIQTLLQGRKILDVNTVSGSHATAYAAETTVFTNNPVSVLADYLRNPRYGKGIDNDSFDWDSFATAAGLCDQVINYTDTTTGKAFTCDAVVDGSGTLMNNVKLLLAGFRGIMPYQAGKYFLKIEHGGDDTDITATPSAPTTVFDITEDHIVGGIQLKGESKQNKINRAIVTFVDPDNDFQPNQVVYPEDGSADDVLYMSEDGVRLEKSFTYNTITSREQALQLAEVNVRKSRNNQMIDISTTADPANVSVGDLIRVTNANLALDGIFRVQGVTLNSVSGFMISATEHNATDYAVNPKSIAAARPTIFLPDPAQVSAPTGLTVQSGSQFNLVSANGEVIRRLFVSWTASTDPFLSNYIVQYRESGNTAYTTVSNTADTSIFISPVALGDEYDVRVAARNEINNRSAFAEVFQHTVTDTYTPASGLSSSTTTTGSLTTITGTWAP